MARKEFTYRGRTAEELQAMSLDEFLPLLPSNERRKARRGFTHEEQSLLGKLERRDKVKTRSRGMIVLPSMIGKTIQVHNGKEYLPVTITVEMVGHRLGQYALTRKPTKHGGAGVTAKKDEKK